jgi:hypothetical protein
MADIAAIKLPSEPFEEAQFLLTLHTKLLLNDQVFHFVAPVHRRGSSAEIKLPITIRWRYPPPVPFWVAPLGLQITIVGTGTLSAGAAD